MRVAYFMHVPWSWARQRPHHVAEGLAARCPMDAYLPADPPRTAAPLRPPTSVTLRPFTDWHAFYRKELPALLPCYDVLWFTSPQYFSEAAPLIRPSQCVIYDCMDEFLSFPGVAGSRSGFARFLLDEISIMDRADLIFCSSETLAQRLQTRYHPPARIEVVNNAAEIEDDPGDTPPPASAGKVVTYVGTVADWMDFDLLLAGLDEFPQSSVHLYGPAEVAIPAHPRLMHHGTQPHAKLHGLMRASDALVMPFKVNDLVTGVDPVKVYEYIHSARPSLVVRYPETERFRRYVHLYDSKDEYLALLRQILQGDLSAPVSPSRAQAFAAANTWARRLAAIAAELNTLTRRRRPDRPPAAHLAHLVRQVKQAASHTDELVAEVRQRDERIRSLERAQARQRTGPMEG